MHSHIPVWVHGVLALLLTLGVFLSRPRAVHPIAPSLIAAGFVMYSLYGIVGSFGSSPVNILSWVAGMFVSVFVVRPYFGPNGMTRVPGSSKVLIPGSWLPLVLIMGIFLTKFIVGFVNGARLPIGTQFWFAPLLSSVLGALSGGFTSRAINVHRYFQKSNLGSLV
jgi:hypothetical protein